MGLLPVDLVHHRGERGRLARAGRPGHEHETAWPHRQLAKRRRKAELLERAQLLGDVPEGRGERAALEVDVHAEAREAGHAVREVELAVDLELLLLLGREDAIEEVPRRVRHDLLLVRERHEIAVDTHGRRRPGNEVEVGRTRLDGAAEQVVDGGRRSVHGHFAYRQGQETA